MNSLTRKIIEAEKDLREFYIAKKGTRTKDLSKVLPAESALKNLKEATKDMLDLWDFYNSWKFGRKVEREWKKMPKPTIKPRKPGYNIDEDLALDDRPRGHI